MMGMGEQVPAYIRLVTVLQVEHGQGECGVDGSGQEERDKLNAEIYALKVICFLLLHFKHKNKHVSCH